MALWIFSFCIMAIEAWGYVYFFDTFLKKKDAGRLQRCRYIVLYPAVVAFALSVKYVGSMGIKVMLAVLLLAVFCGLFYRTDWKQSIFFSMLNYSLLFLTDILLLLTENVLASKDQLCALEYDFLYIPMKMVWILLLFMIRKIWKGRSNFRELSRKEWGVFFMVPLLTVASMLLMYFCYSGERKVQTAYLFLSVGLIFINIFVIELMQGILEKEELLRESALAGQKKESQLAHYRDMQAVYERQGRNAVVHVKLVQEGGKLIFSVRNPVVEKVEVTEGTGLSNVKAVADKYGGDFAVSCDAEKFQAVVML